jgi:hypothetical protein
MLLHELPDDALRHIFTHVELPYVLKLACRTLRAAGPKRTLTTMGRVARSKQSLRLAHAMRFPFTWDATFTGIIARSGNLDALVWANDALCIPFDKFTNADAAMAGNLEILEWLHVVHNDGFDSRDVARVAARFGHFGIVRWVHSLGMAIDYHAANEVAERGDFATFQWLIEVLRIPIGRSCLTRAARGSGMHKNGEHVKIIEFVWGREGPHFIPKWDSSAFVWSVRKASLEMLKYMRSNDCGDECPEDTLTEAAYGNRLDVLQWLCTDLPHIYEPNLFATCAAATKGHLELLQWLRARGCPWDWRATYHAAENNHMHVLRWMAANGGHIYDANVRLERVLRKLVQTPAGPLPDQMVPGAMWIRALMRWRKVKLLVLFKWGVARFWQKEAQKRG